MKEKIVVSQKESINKLEELLNLYKDRAIIVL